MRMNLNSDWRVRCEDIGCTAEDADAVLARTDGWWVCDVPCDVREPLIREGIIAEPLEGMNCFDSEWVEKRSWWFHKNFDATEYLLSSDVLELNLDSLDFGADVFLNGHCLGLHLSAFYPFRQDVKGLLRVGHNDLLVRLTTGLERISEDDMRGYRMSSEEERRPGRGDRRKGFLRKPQYSFGWDWNPRVATCGIMKDVWLESHRKAAIRQVHAFTRAIAPEAKVALSVEIENFHPFSTREADLRASISLNGSPVVILETGLLLRSGILPLELELSVPEPRLWWPNGMGDQTLYVVRVSMTVEGTQVEYPPFSFGIRTVRLDLSKLDGGGRRFAFVLNDVRIFCKGGNWVPADSLYARVTNERYETLVREAKEANFNMLRVWGGGLYERDAFYESCDRHGILLWHDFMFACSEYPDDQPWFVDLVEREVEYQTRRLCNHPSLALWCGNNENHWGFDEWWKEKGYFGSKAYNRIAPLAVQRNCSEIPYWNSSPYGGEHPNGKDIGDRHHWGDCMMNEEMRKRISPEEYDEVHARFVSEYGYIGPSRLSSIRRYLTGAPFDIAGEVWQHHNNTFEKDTVLAGIRYHYADPDAMVLTDYLLYAGLCQGLMYAYSLEAFRFDRECSGGLFWMYDDCWGETGWTIIDYYLRRKISYYFVKRAFAPVKVVLREKDGEVVAAFLNDTPDSVEMDVEFGYASYDGSTRRSDTRAVILLPFIREHSLRFPKDGHDEGRGTYFVKPSLPQVLPALLRTRTWRSSELPPASLSIEAFEREGRDAKVIVRSAGFAHAVHFDLPDDTRLSDDYFDLLPGEVRQVHIHDAPEGLDLKTLSIQSFHLREV